MRPSLAGTRFSMLTLICAFAVICACGRCADLPISIILVRHAEKAGPDSNDDPGLQHEGELRAAVLENMLADAGITAIYASQWLRTQLTVKPLADRLHLKIHKIAAEKTAELVQSILNGTDHFVVVAAHSNTLPQIIQALGGGSVPKIEDGWEFDNLYVVTLYAPDKASTVRMHYGEPSKPPGGGQRAAMPNKGTETMRLTFSRSGGGFVYTPTMNITGVVDLTTDGGSVTSDETGYRRDLSPDEAKQVYNKINSPRFLQFKEGLEPHMGANIKPSRTDRHPETDQYQYDITVQLTDGKEHRVRIPAHAGNLEQLAPGLKELLNWIQEESEMIWKHKKVQGR